jgi:hypothetical protein
MKHCYIGILIIPLFSLIFSCNLRGQSWEYVKEKDGIKLYTRNELNSTFKAFKGEVIFKANIEKVNLLVGDADNLDWWDKDIVFIKVLDFKRNNYIQYYIIYDLPGPLSNRDLALDARISIDPVTGVRTVVAKPLLNVVPEKKDLVRIKKYWQKWTIQPLDKGYVRVTLEGFVDPNGNVPAWIHNMVVPEMPLKALQALRERSLSDKPAKKLAN